MVALTAAAPVQAQPIPEEWSAVAANAVTGTPNPRVTITANRDAIFSISQADQVLTLALGGSATKGSDYMLSQQQEMPKITLAASRDTIIAGLEALVLTATREAPLAASVAVTLRLTQEQNWLSRTSHRLNFAAGGSTANLNLSRVLFSSDVTESGNLTATVDSVSGYDTEDATATVFAVSQPNAAIRVSIDNVAYTYQENEDSAVVTGLAWAAAGMPRGATVTFATVSRSGTATSGSDFVPLSETLTVREEDYRLVNGRWAARFRVPVTLLDDEIYEGTESFGLLLEAAAGTTSELLVTNHTGDGCQADDCPQPVYITDDEDIPEWALAVNPAEIREEGETSSAATVSITNGKSFAADQLVTFRLGGDAIPGHDYLVTPADADGAADHHQVLLPTGSSSVEVTFTAIDDEREEGDESITLSVAHEGNTIGGGSIRLVDRFPGPRVEITFEGVQPPRDEYTAGVATGPFTTRFTFSERVEGFTQDDIEWQTHSLTTIDTTNIGVLVWDYTVIREGREYTARMMPDQNGRLWIDVFPGAARSVATGDGNQLGASSLGVELPPNRLMVAPTTLTVVEGDRDGGTFMVVPTSPPTGNVTVMVTGTDGTDLNVDWSTWTFGLPYWNGGWGVTITAAHDDDTANEQVRLWVKAFGGGYDGRGADLTVNIRDDDGTSADRRRDLELDQDDLEEALGLLGDVTPEAAAAALFGEHDLSEAQLGALDLLGNGNGIYDLGDLLSWVAFCRRGEANCDQTSLPDSNPHPGASAGLAAGGQGGRSSHRNGGSPGPRISRASRNRQERIRRARVRRRGIGPSRSFWPAEAHGRSSAPAWNGLALWYAVVLLLGAVLFWGCIDGDSLVDPRTPDPGDLTVQLVAPSGARGIGAMLVVEGPNIDSVKLSDETQSSDFEVFQSGTDSSRQVIVSGGLSSGPLLQFRVPDRERRAEYRVRLLQVAGADYALQDPARYAVTISR